MVLPKDKQKKRFNHFENRRLWKLAVVLTNAQQRDKTPAMSQDELTNKSKRNLAAVFKAAVYAEKNRVKKIKVCAAKEAAVPCAALVSCRRPDSHHHPTCHTPDSKHARRSWACSPARTPCCKSAAASSTSTLTRRTSATAACVNRARHTGANSRSGELTA